MKNLIYLFVDRSVMFILLKTVTRMRTDPIFFPEDYIKFFQSSYHIKTTYLSIPSFSLLKSELINKNKSAALLRKENFQFLDSPKNVQKKSL